MFYKINILITPKSMQISINFNYISKTLKLQTKLNFTYLLAYTLHMLNIYKIVLLVYVFLINSTKHLILTNFFVGDLADMVADLMV